MYVREVMTDDVQIVSPEQTIQEAARVMEDIDCGVLLVGEDDRLIGMVTDRDITVRAVARGKPPDQCTVREVMSPGIKYVYQDEAVEDITRNMSRLQVRRLPVLNRKKRLVGIVSLGDLAVNDPHGAGRALKGVSMPAG